MLAWQKAQSDTQLIVIDTTKSDVRAWQETQADTQYTVIHSDQTELRIQHAYAGHDSSQTDLQARSSNSGEVWQSRLQNARQ